MPPNSRVQRWSVRFHRTLNWKWTCVLHLCPAFMWSRSKLLNATLIFLALFFECFFHRIPAPGSHPRCGFPRVYRLVQIASFELSRFNQKPKPAQDPQNAWTIFLLSDRRFRIFDRIDHKNCNSQSSQFRKKSELWQKKMKNCYKIKKHNRSCRIRAVLIKRVDRSRTDWHRAQRGLITRKWWKVITHFSNQTSSFMPAEYPFWTHSHDLALRFGS